MEKILIVEDQQNLFELLNHRLKKIGYPTLWAKDGEEALKLISEERPDLVVLDIMIPFINGIQVLKTIKKDPELSKIPVIILSSKANDKDVLSGLELGVEDYITKPYNPQEVTLRIQTVLKRFQT